MEGLLNAKVDIMIGMYDVIRTEFRWSSSMITSCFTALIYTLNNKEFDTPKFKELQNYIKENTKVFSHYRSYEIFSIASLLITKFENPEESFKNLLLYEDKLAAEGFSKGAHLAISAFTLMLTCSPLEINERIHKAREIYKKMKEKHFWLTGRDDYPLAALISSYDKDSDAIIDQIESCFNALHEEGFSKSNGLQQLSHILTFSTLPPEDKAKRCAAIRNYFKEHKIHVYSQDYGLMGLIALTGDVGEKMLEEIVEVYKYIKATRGYKWLGAQVNFLISCSIVCDSYIEDVKQSKGLIETSIGISIEAIIAAQTAAMIACIAAASATASSASHST